jgi:hypothetical protein
VVATAKDGITPQTTSPYRKGQMLDYERGGPADITTPYWLTDDAVSSSSWSYTQGMQYYTTTALVHAFVDRVSKGGNLLLNLSPMADGTFPQQQKDIMAAFGKFLKQMGTAIYNTRAWAVYGEGPTKLGGGGMGTPTAMTSSDIRYTKSKDGDAVYALLMGWPGNGKQVTLASVTTSRFALGSGKVFLFGPTGDGTGEIALQEATQDSSGLHITLPSTQPYTALAYAIKISKSGTAPEATPWSSGGAGTIDGGIGGAGGNSGADGGGAGAGGSPGAGGRSGAGGAGGATTNPSNTGGALGSGGVTGTGGASGSGGGIGTGGARSSGGATGAGGSSAAGGAGSGGAAGSTAAGGSGRSAGGGTSGGAGAGGAAGASGNGGNGGSSPSGGNSGSSGGRGGSGTTTTASSNSTGCTCAIQGTASSSAGASLLALGLIAVSLVRRRRHRR